MKTTIKQMTAAPQDKKIILTDDEIGVMEILLEYQQDQNILNLEGKIEAKNLLKKIKPLIDWDRNDDEDPRNDLIWTCDKRYNF